MTGELVTHLEQQPATHTKFPTWSLRFKSCSLPGMVWWTEGMADRLICRRCGRPVTIETSRYDLFEGMHQVCFHYEFEHDPYDPDEECAAGDCPSAAIRPRPDRRPRPDSN